MGALQELLDDLRRWLVDAKGIVDNGSDPLSQSDKDDLAALLDDVEGGINDLYDTNTSPTLSPSDAGTADTSVDTSTLSKCADSAATLAEEADTEGETASPDHDYIGDRMKTIRDHILPDYRTKAGIGTSPPGGGV